MTGYDLKTLAFDKTVAHFWPAVQQQIYRELEKLTAAGWVTFEIEYQTDKPNRKVYHITAEGRAEFAAWLGRSQPLSTYREAFLIQLFFAAQLPKAAILDMLREQRAAHQARHEALKNIHIPPPSPERRKQHALSELTRELGLRIEEAYLAWLDHAMQVAAAFDDEQ